MTPSPFSLRMAIQYTKNRTCSSHVRANPYWSASATRKADIVFLWYYSEATGNHGNHPRRQDTPYERQTASTTYHHQAGNKMEACRLRLSHQNHMEQGSQCRKCCRVATPHRKKASTSTTPRRLKPPRAIWTKNRKFHFHQNPIRRMPRGGGTARKEDERNLCQDLRHGWNKFQRPNRLIPQTG